VAGEGFCHLPLQPYCLRQQNIGERIHYLNYLFRIVSSAGNRLKIQYEDRLPVVVMIGWHVTRHWAAGDGVGDGLFYQNDADVEAINNLAIGFPFFGTRSLVNGYRVRARIRVGLGLGLGVSESFIAGCRQAIRENQLPVAGCGYMTYLLDQNFAAE